MKTYAISEAVAICGLPESTLRYYERIGLIDRVSRNTSSKHRTYTEDDLDRITIIACLSATGMSIADMRAYMANRGDRCGKAREQVELLTRQHERLVEDIRNLQLRARYVAAKITYWEAVERADQVQTEQCSATTLAIADELHLPRTARNRQ